MPGGKMTVDPEQTEDASKALAQAVENLQGQLDTVRTQVDNLLQTGYDTPAAREKFKPMHDEYIKNSTKLNETLDGMGQFLQKVGQGFADTDSQFGGQLNQA